MEDGPQPPERVAYLLRQACESLEEAHQRGLIHRDVKPANIFVCRYPFHLDFVKVLDFGMVKAQHVGGESPDGLTRVGRVTGTPAFLPPEAVIEDYPKDGRADIYGLGCVAYWLLTGLPVFDRESSMGMMVAHARETPVPVSEHAPDVPDGLERIVMSCLEKHPDMRPSSAAKLGDLLDELGIASAWTAERATGWWQAREGRTEE
jgi:serine/threonine-protein kinase